MRVRLVACWVASMALGLSVGTFADRAQASVSIAVTWDGLLRASTSAVVVTPIESRSTWENDRIWTYARVRVDRAIAGELTTGSEAWVRTMGGVVGKIGQIVEGEAVLAPGQPSLLFLHSGAAGAFEVTARGQGQFLVEPAAGNAPARVVRSHSVGALFPPPVLVSSPATQLAADVLHGRSVDDVAFEVSAQWASVHAHL